MNNDVLGASISALCCLDFQWQKYTSSSRTFKLRFLAKVCKLEKGTRRDWGEGENYLIQASLIGRLEVQDFITQTIVSRLLTMLRQTDRTTGSLYFNTMFAVCGLVQKKKKL